MQSEVTLYFFLFETNIFSQLPNLLLSIILFNEMISSQIPQVWQNTV